MERSTTAPLKKPRTEAPANGHLPLGFGLDLDNCAASGETTDLIYVSPKSGGAVSRAAGEPWRDRLLPLPAFLH